VASSSYVVAIRQYKKERAMHEQVHKSKGNQGGKSKPKIGSQNHTYRAHLQDSDLPPDFLAIIARARKSHNQDVLRIKDTSKKMCRAVSTLWSDCKKGTLAPPIRIGEKIVAWRAVELDAILEAHALSTRSGRPINMRLFVALLIAPNPTVNEEDSAT
jgi:predicted DNA-binding transcriptional regulator AlpA